MTPRTLIYAGDHAIAAMSILLFLGSVVVLFFIARRLFDQHLALLTCGLVLLCDMIWQYSLSGLPQMLLLLAVQPHDSTLLVRAVEARYGGESRRSVARASSALGFGLLALTSCANDLDFFGSAHFLRASSFGRAVGRR